MVRVCGVIFLLASLLLGGCNSGPRVSVSADGSEATMSKTITVLPGQTVKISTFGAVNPDCTPAGEGVYRLTQRPAQGRVDARREMVFPTFRDSNVRARCNVQRTPGTLVTPIAPTQMRRARTPSATMSTQRPARFCITTFL